MNQNKNILSGIVPFIVAPFASALYAITKSEDKWAKIVIALFTALYGFCAIPDVTMDFYRYLHSLESFSWNDLAEYDTDYYTYFVTGIVSLITKNGHVLMAIFGVIYGGLFAYSLSLFKKTSEISSFIYVLFVFTFASIYSLVQFGGVRFGTAFYTFYISVYYYIIMNDRRYLLGLLIVPFIHFSYTIYIVAFIIFYIFRNKPYIIISLFIASFFFSAAGLSNLLTQYSVYWGEGIAEKSQIYTEIDFDEFTHNYQGAFWTRIGDILYWCELIALVLIFFTRKRFREFENESMLTIYKMILFCLVLFSAYNIFEAIPHLGIRTRGIATSFVILPIYLFCKEYWNSHDLKVRLIAYVTLFGGAFQIIMCFRQLSNLTPISLVFCPLPLVEITETTMNVLLGLK
nr:hypothetical protein [uncultured Macellibacteroides sp.]